MTCSLSPLHVIWGSRRVGLSIHQRFVQWWESELWLKYSKTHSLLGPFIPHFPLFFFTFFSLLSLTFENIRSIYCMVLGILGVSLVIIQSHIAMRTSFLIYWMTLPNFSKSIQGGTSGKVSTYQTEHARDSSLIPGLGRSPGIGSGNPFQYSCLKNHMGRGAWQARVHGVTTSETIPETTGSEIICTFL